LLYFLLLAPLLFLKVLYLFHFTPKKSVSRKIPKHLFDLNQLYEIFFEVHQSLGWPVEQKASEIISRLSVRKSEEEVLKEITKENEHN